MNCDADVMVEFILLEAFMRSSSNLRISYIAPAGNSAK